jgi:hypothetical protein
MTIWPSLGIFDPRPDVRAAPGNATGRDSDALREKAARFHSSTRWIAYTRQGLNFRREKKLCRHQSHPVQANALFAL